MEVRKFCASGVRVWSANAGGGSGAAEPDAGPGDAASAQKTGERDAAWFRDTISALRTEIGNAIVGQDEIVEGALCGLAANGHVLLEGLPGLGKTLLVRSLASALDMGFGRIQFTPDLMPADVTGTNVLMGTGDSGPAGGGRVFEFRRGPVFTNLLLADEINRATPKTQSALLEAMQERSVTVAGVRHELEEPFLVMATQNPIEQEGTYPLPEAQLDRFLLKMLVGYPSKGELGEIVGRTTGTGEPKVGKVADRAAALRMRDVLRSVPVAKAVLDFALELVLATHPRPATGEAEPARTPDSTKRYVRYGSSPRGAQALVTAGKFFALIDGRFNVSKEDLVRAAKPSLRHRIILNFEAEADGVCADDVIEECVRSVQSADRDPISV